MTATRCLFNTSKSGDELISLRETFGLCEESFTVVDHGPPKTSPHLAVRIYVPQVLTRLYCGKPSEVAAQFSVGSGASLLLRQKRCSLDSFFSFFLTREN